MLRDKRGLTLAGLIVALIVILAIGFGIYRIFLVTKPLKIKDLEDIYIVTTRSSLESGWAINVGCERAIDFFGHVLDNRNEYEDRTSVDSALRVCIIVDQDRDVEWEDIDIRAGDRVELTYDGGRRLLIYLPEITQKDLTSPEVEKLPHFELYVASDGSTYYDKRLTRLAQSAP